MLTLLRNAELYDPRPRGATDVLVAGGRVLAIGPSLPEPPRGWPLEVVDLDRRIVFPGLVDLHAHITGGGGEAGAHTRVPPVALSAFTTAGVTSVVGVLGTDGTTRSIAELLAAARALEHGGMSAWCYTGSYEVPPVTLTGSVRADIVNVDRIVAVGEIAISDARSSQPSFDEVVRLAADAHVAGMMSGKAGVLHLHVGDGPRGLTYLRRALAETELPARVFHPTHCNRNRRLWKEAKALAPRGVTIDATAMPRGDEGQTAGQAIVDWLTSNLDPGRLTISSDGGGCLPELDADGRVSAYGVGAPSRLLDAVREARDAGVELHTALMPVTSNPARLFRLAGKGRIEVGSAADLVVAADDLRPEMVMAGGRWLVREGRPVVQGAFEPR